MSLDFLVQMNHEPKKPGVALIDISQLAIATAVQNFSGKEYETFNIGMMRHLILSTLKSNVVRARKEGYPTIVVTVDNTHMHGYTRRDIADYYKRNRQKMREDSKFDFDGFFEHFPTVLQEIQDNMPYIVLSIPRIEADDHIGVITNYCLVRNIPVLIMSSDGDFTQLHKGDMVKQWSPTLKKFVKPKFGSSHMDLMVKIVKGDKKDGVSPIQTRNDFYVNPLEGQRAPSAATKWIESIADCTTDEQIEKLLNDGTLWKRFKENRDLIDLSRIPDVYQEQIREMYENAVPASKGKMYKYFIRSGLSKLLKDIDQF